MIIQVHQLNYRTLLLFLLGFIACNQGSRPPVDLNQQEMLDLLQGAWQDTTGQIYYVKKDSVLRFEDGRFYHSILEISKDTIYNFSRNAFFKHEVISTLTKDSLITVIPETTVRNKFSRPSLKALRLDTMTVKPDSIISKTEKEINGNDFELSIRSDYEEHVFINFRLKNCKDSCMKLRHDLFLKGGDCNGNFEQIFVYEIINNTLVFFSEEYSNSHMDDRDPHESFYYTKEIYTVQKNGRIILSHEETAKNKPQLKKEVLKKLKELKWKKD